MFGRSITSYICYRLIILVVTLGCARTKPAPQGDDEYEDASEVGVGDQIRLQLNNFLNRLPAIYPIINGIPCFTLNETSEFRSSSGDSVVCTCRKGTRSELPLVREYKTWRCLRSSISQTPTTATRRPMFNPERKTTTKRSYIVNGDASGSGIATSIRPGFGILSTSGTKKPTSSTNQPWEGGLRPISSAVTTTQAPQTEDQGCNYCILVKGASSYRCVPAYNYECANELRRLSYYNKPTECVDDYWTYKQFTKICHSQDESHLIYMAIGSKQPPNKLV